MNESIRIRLHRDGTPLPLDSLTQEGAVLGGESSASPRGITLSLRPGNPLTEFRLRRVRAIQDWAPGAFRFTVTLEGGEIVCRGVDPFSLPFGRYRLQVVISDLEPIGQPLEIEVPESGAAEMVAKFRADPRVVKLVTPVDEFDDRVKAIVLDSGSRLDGESVPRWLAGPARPQRKACLLNVLAKARATRGPALKSSLIDGVQTVFFADVDRIYVTCSGGFLSHLRALAADAAKPFYYEGAPKAAGHRKLLDRIGPAHAGLERDAARFRLHSFRQEGRPSMQAVVAVPPGGDPSRPHYADLDIDLGNPLQDLAGMLIHFGEVLNPGRTDHLKLAGKLAKGPTRDFHYYRVVTLK